MRQSDYRRRGPYRRTRWAKALEKADKKAGTKKKPAKRKEYGLLATSIPEYHKLKRDYPNMRITLDTSRQEQEQLFDTKELTEDEQ